MRYKATSYGLQMRWNLASPEKLFSCRSLWLKLMLSIFHLLKCTLWVRTVWIYTAPWLALEALESFRRKTPRPSMQCKFKQAAGLLRVDWWNPLMGLIWAGCCILMVAFGAPASAPVACGFTHTMTRSSPREVCCLGCQGSYCLAAINTLWLTPPDEEKERVKEQK